MGLLRKVQVEEPRPEDLTAFRKMLEDSPGLWRAIGDLANISQQIVLQDRYFSLDIRLAVEIGIEDVKKDYGYEEARGLERMLIDQIVVNWLQLQRTQTRYEYSLRKDDASSESDHWEQRLNAANARYLRACETLARVRKLSQWSAVQVNIGRHQVNVAQTANRGNDDSSEQIQSVSMKQLASPSNS